MTTAITKGRANRWQEKITNTDLNNNSKKAWTTIKNLVLTGTQQSGCSTPNDVAHQLLLNGKPNNQEKGHLKKLKLEMDQAMHEGESHLDPVSIEELQKTMEHLKLGKAAGLDGISTEVIKHFGPETQQWILELFNICATSCKITKTWRKAKVVAILKPGKDPNNKKDIDLSLFYVFYTSFMSASSWVKCQMTKKKN